MVRDLLDFATKMQSLAELINDYDNQLTKLLQQHSKHLAEIEGGKRFDATEAEVQTEIVKQLEEAAQEMDTAQEAVYALADIFAEIKDSM